MVEIKNLGQMLFEVESFTTSGQKYVVDLKEKTCTCPDFRYRGRKCKHIKAVEEKLEEERGEMEIVVVPKGVLGYKILDGNGERW